MSYFIGKALEILGSKIELVTFYWILIVIGMGYLLTSFFLGAHDFGDLSGVEHAGGVDGADGGFHFNIFSPLTMSLLFLDTGALGFITIYIFKFSPLVSVVSSSAGAVVLASLTSYFVYSIFLKSQGSAATQLDDLIGLDARVIVPIKGNGVGKIEYVSKAGIQTMLAHSVNGEDIARDKPVRIVKVAGGRAYVKEI